MQSIFGTSDYFSFLAVGMLSFVTLFTAMFSGMSIVWDRRFGFLDKVLSTPVSRGAIVMGKVFSSVLRSLAQAAIVLLIAVPLGMDLTHLTVVGIAGTFVALFLMTLGFSALFLMLALRSTDWQSQMAIMNLLNLPLLFGSNALFPSSFMPELVAGLREDQSDKLCDRRRHGSFCSARPDSPASGSISSTLPPSQSPSLSSAS